MAAKCYNSLDTNFRQNSTKTKCKIKEDCYSESTNLPYKAYEWSRATFPTLVAPLELLHCITFFTKLQP